MDEKVTLENVLTLNKSLIMLCINGVIESTNTKVLNLFKKSLDSLLNMQEDTFNLMSKKQIYNLENVKKSEIAKLYTKMKGEN